MTLKQRHSFAVAKRLTRNSLLDIMQGFAFRLEMFKGVGQRATCQRRALPGLWNRGSRTPASFRKGNRGGRSTLEMTNRLMTHGPKGRSPTTCCWHVLWQLWPGRRNSGARATASSAGGNGGWEYMTLNCGHALSPLGISVGVWPFLFGGCSINPTVRPVPGRIGVCTRLCAVGLVHWRS